MEEYGMLKGTRKPGRAQGTGKVQGCGKVKKETQRTNQNLPLTENKNRDVSYIDLEMYEKHHCHTNAPLQVCSP